MMHPTAIVYVDRIPSKLTDPRLSSIIQRLSGLLILIVRQLGLDARIRLAVYTAVRMSIAAQINGTFCEGTFQWTNSADER